GTYYLQTGGDGYRIYRLRGLAEAVRGGGTLTVTPAQLMAAERRLARRETAAATPKEAAIPLLSQPPRLDGSGTGWPKEPAVAWDRSGQFPVKVRCGHDATHLYLSYEVRDESPWVNRGKD